VKSFSAIVLRALVLVLAVLELFYWGYNLPLLLMRPVSEIFNSGWQGLLGVFGLVVFPACAAVGGVLAILGQRLALAAMLVAVQPLVFSLVILILIVTGHTGPWIRIGR
jgi:hypothetical protein